MLLCFLFVCFVFLGMEIGLCLWEIPFVQRDHYDSYLQGHRSHKRRNKDLSMMSVDEIDEMPQEKMGCTMRC